MNKFAKRLMTGVLAGALATSMALPAFAAGPETIKVTGLTAGDKVTAYQVLVADPTAPKGWKLVDALKDVDGITVDSILDGVTPDEFGKIASKLSGGTAENVSGTEWSKSNADAGTYVVIVQPKDTATIYNPMVVSSDYDTTNTTNQAAAKKDTITVTKSTSTAQRDVAAGDVVDFKIESKVPAYPSNYTNPTYEISDTLTGQIALNKGSEFVKVGDDTLQKDTDYTITEADKTFTIKFTPTYLAKVIGADDTATELAKKVEVTYKATVTADQAVFTDNVNRINNKAEVKFSNDPTNASDYKTVTDETNHYTFSLDANIAGQTESVAKEIVKVGVGTDGQPITEEQTINGDVKGAPLGGATFTLTGGESKKTYTATSTNDGLLNFNGLDQGTYILKETQAPAGFLLNTAEYTVVITPTYSADGKTLESYKVEITDSDSKTVTSNYTITNNAINKDVVTSTDGDATSLYKNTKANGLPTTGGMGTTIFYIAGIVLVGGAAILLVTRRRMSAR